MNRQYNRTIYDFTIIKLNTIKYSVFTEQNAHHAS